MSPRDPLDLIGQETAEAERETQQRLAALAEVEDLRWLLSSKRGRRIVWRQLERAGVYRISFDTNAMRMAFNEGLRNEGLRLMSSAMRDAPGHYSLMIEEHKPSE